MIFIEHLKLPERLKSKRTAQLYRAIKNCERFSQRTPSFPGTFQKKEHHEKMLRNIRKNDSDFPGELFKFSQEHLRFQENMPPRTAILNNHWMLSNLTTCFL